MEPVRFNFEVGEPSADHWLLETHGRWFTDPARTQLRCDVLQEGFGQGMGVGKRPAERVGDVVLLVAKKVEYGVDFKRVMRGRLVLGIGDGWMKADGETIYHAKDLKVGLFKAEALRASAEAVPAQV